MTTQRNGRGQLLFNSTRKDAFEEDPWLKSLHERLTAISGKGVILWIPDEFLEGIKEDTMKLLGTGQVWHTQNIQMHPGRPQGCHRNAFELLLKHPKAYGLISGYFLGGSNAYWLPHSWVWSRRSKQIIETTVKANFYFGMDVSTSENDLLSFAVNKGLVRREPRPGQQR